MAKNSIDAYGASGKSNVLFFEPENLHLVTDTTHPLYDERVHLPLNEAVILNIMELGVGVTHIIFSIVFAVGYCVVAEVFPKIKLWQGLLAGALAQLFVHMISFPLMGLTPPLLELPWYENVSEIFGHLVWFWSIEIIRRDLRNRITHEPDAEVSLNAAFR